MMGDPGLEEDIRLARLGAAKEVPDAATLSAAPLLDCWWTEAIQPGVFRLKGAVTGHPRIRDGWCTTGPVIAVADDRTWVRTLSRYYRLRASVLEKIE